MTYALTSRFGKSALLFAALAAFSLLDSNLLEARAREEDAYFQKKVEVPWPYGKCQFLAVSRFFLPEAPSIACVTEDHQLKILSLVHHEVRELRSVAIRKPYRGMIFSRIADNDRDDLILWPEHEDDSLTLYHPNTNSIQELPFSHFAEGASQAFRPAVIDQNNRGVDLLLSRKAKASENDQTTVDAHLHQTAAGLQILAQTIDVRQSREKMVDLYFPTGDKSWSISTTPRAIVISTLLRNTIQDSRSIVAPNGFTWEFSKLYRMAEGDFQSALAYAGPIGGWWILPFQEEAWTPQSISGLPLLGVDETHSLIVDLNNDGHSDALFLRDDHLEIYYGTLLRQIPPQVSPQTCSGTLASIQQNGDGFFHCPSGHYILSLDNTLVEQPIAGAETLQAVCCPFPSDDFLLDQGSVEKGVCPEDAIVTGIETVYSSPPYPLRVFCSKLNPQRIRLGVTEPGRYFGHRPQGNTLNFYSSPPALRNALARRGIRNWDFDGCAGFPWGSMLRGIVGPKCDGSRFSEAQDVQSQKLQLYPDCVKEPERFGKDTGCQ